MPANRAQQSKVELAAHQTAVLRRTWRFSSQPVLGQPPSGQVPLAVSSKEAGCGWQACAVQRGGCCTGRHVTQGAGSQ